MLYSIVYILSLKPTPYLLRMYNQNIIQDKDKDKDGKGTRLFWRGSWKDEGWKRESLSMERLSKDKDKDKDGVRNE